MHCSYHYNRTPSYLGQATCSFMGVLFSLCCCKAFLLSSHANSVLIGRVPPTWGTGSVVRTSLLNCASTTSEQSVLRGKSRPASFRTNIAKLEPQLELSSPETIDTTINIFWSICSRLVNSSEGQTPTVQHYFFTSWKMLKVRFI